MAKENKRKLTPIGFAKWAHLEKPKISKISKFEKDPKFQIDVCFSIDDPAWKEWASNLKKSINDLPVQIDKGTGQPKPKQMPIKREMDANEQPTGRYFVTFSTGEQFKPSVFNQYGIKMNGGGIGNDSKVKVSYVESSYDTFGGGIKLYLNAVQVLEIVEFQNQTATAYGFEVKPIPLGAIPQQEDDLPF